MERVSASRIEITGGGLDSKRLCLLLYLLILLELQEDLQSGKKEVVLVVCVCVGGHVCVVCVCVCVRKVVLVVCVCVCAQVCVSGVCVCVCVCVCPRL